MEPHKTKGNSPDPVTEKPLWVEVVCHKVEIAERKAFVRRQPRHGKEYVHQVNAADGVEKVEAPGADVNGLTTPWTILIQLTKRSKPTRYWLSQSIEYAMDWDTHQGLQERNIVWVHPKIPIGLVHGEPEEP